jgi:hypothetical protein
LSLAVDDKIVAVTPNPELRLFMEERIYVQRKPSGWEVGAVGVKYDSPDDWSITFTARPCEAGGEVRVGMASLEGDKDVLPTRIIRLWRTCVISQPHLAASMHSRGVSSSRWPCKLDAQVRALVSVCRCWYT